MSESSLDNMQDGLSKLSFMRRDFNWEEATMDIKEYPIGTKYRAILGGYWIRVQNGFKWCTGSTFPNVGADWDGTVSIPNIAMV